MKDKALGLFKNTYFFEWYYILVIFGYIATLFFAWARPGVLASALIVIVAGMLIIRKKMNIHSVMDVLIVCYFIYKSATIICILQSGMPTYVYTGEVAASLIPMVFYFAGRACKDRLPGFYGRFLSALLILGAVSMLLYITAPQFYCDYLYRWSYISKADASTMRVRMQSVMGCTLFGALMVYGMAAGIFFLCSSDKDELKQKNNRIFGGISVLITMFFAFMSNQRAAMVVAIALLLYINYLAFVKFEGVSKKIAIIEIAVIILAIALLCVIRFDFVLKIWLRLASLPGAVSQRSEQWVAAVNNMYSSWFGNGLGANGHKAIGIEGAHVIPDGGLIKMYCEEGVIGFSIFLYILITSIRRGVKAIHNYYAELAIIAVSLLLSIGSNILAFQLATPIFWFAIGRIWDSPDSEELVSFRLFKRGKNK